MQGNPTRTASTLDAIAAGAAPPPELDVVRTPRTGHRVDASPGRRCSTAPSPFRQAGRRPRSLHRRERRASAERVGGIAAARSGEGAVRDRTRRWCGRRHRSRRELRLTELHLSPLDVSTRRRPGRARRRETRAAAPPRRGAVIRRHAARLDPARPARARRQTGRRTTSSYGEFAEMVRAAHALITGDARHRRQRDESSGGEPACRRRRRRAEGSSGPARPRHFAGIGRAGGVARRIGRCQPRRRALAARSLLAIRDQRRRASVVSGWLERGPRGAVRASATPSPVRSRPAIERLNTVDASRPAGLPTTTTRDDTTWRGCRRFSASRSSSFRCSQPANVAEIENGAGDRAPTFKTVTRWRSSPGIRGPAACARASSASRRVDALRGRAAHRRAAPPARRAAAVSSRRSLGRACRSKRAAAVARRGSRSSSSRRRRSTCIARWPAC